MDQLGRALYMGAGLFWSAFWALAFAHVAIVVPYALRTIHAQLRAVPEDLEWAARTLGATRTRTLLRVTLPLCARGVLSVARG